MIVLSIIYLIASNAATLRRDKSILYARTAIVIILCSFILNINTYYNEFFDNPIGLFGGLYEITANTHIFHMFMFIITGIILLLNSFYPRKVYFEEINWVFGLQPSVYNNSFIVNKMSEQFRLIEYSLVILFIVIGGIFLICSSDLISLFLSIELQSYGLYILCAIYRNSEKAIGGALMYFLLGGLSSCFILLSSALLYGNSGNTSFDGLYILNDISNTSEGNIYNYYFINMSLIILIVGLLFKISAAPFHFWSPDVYDSVPTIVTTFIAVFTKISILILMLIIVTNINKYTYTNDLDINQQINQSLNNSWILVLLVSSLLSLIIGSILGLTQFRVKRLYAYSTISHLGFILLALVVNTIESTQSFIFYVMQYSITNLNAFFLLVTIGYSLYIYVEKETKTGNERTHNSDKNDSPLQLINQFERLFLY